MMTSSDLIWKGVTAECHSNCMKFLDKGQSIDLLGESSAFPTHCRGAMPEHEEASTRIPLDAGSISQLAQALAETIRLPCILRFGDMHVWPSCSNWPLADSVRRGLGQEREWHLLRFAGIDLGERDSLSTLLSLALICHWDLEIIEEGQQRSWSISHDEFVDCWSSQSDLLAKSQEILSSWGGEP